MQARKKTTVRYSKIIVPCSKCGHGCEVSLGYSGEDETSGSSSESEAEVKPSAKKAKLAVEPDSGSDSDSDAPVATTVPQKPAINSRVSSSSSNSDSDSEAPVHKTAVAVVREPVTTLRASSSSSESSDSSDSESDAPIPTALTKPLKPVALKPRAPSPPSSESSSDSDTPVSTVVPTRAPKPAVLNTGATSSSSDSSDSDSSSESGSSDSVGPRFPKPLERSSVQQFFSQFPSFQYDSSQPVMTEYSRMSQTKGFKSLSQAARRNARRDLKDALAKDFGRLYGYDVNDLGAWQSLCRVLRFEDVPDDLEGCQDLVTATYVNIIDLIDTVSTGAPVQHFDSEKELSEYTIQTKNILSRNSPHAGSLLKFLLRNIYSPTDATRKNPEPLYALNRKRKRGA